MISLKNGKELWVSFKYEQLSNLCYWCGSLIHDDRDCELWIENEGTLPTKTQQYGAWIRAPPFVQSKRNLVSIPGFYKTKSFSPTTTSTPKSSAKPQVVIRRGGLALEIIKSGQGSDTPIQEGIKFPHVQEANSMESRPFHTNHNNLGEVNAINTDQNRGSLSAELFEEKLEELNHDLRNLMRQQNFIQNQTLLRVR